MQGKVWKTKKMFRMAQDLWEMLSRTHATAKELQIRVASTGIAIDMTAIWCTLKDKYLHDRDARKNDFLRPHLKLKHLKYAKENIEKHEALWNNMLWSDF